MRLSISGASLTRPLDRLVFRSKNIFIALALHAIDGGAAAAQYLLVQKSVLLLNVSRVCAKSRICSTYVQMLSLICTDFSLSVHSSMFCILQIQHLPSAVALASSVVLHFSDMSQLHQTPHCM